MDNNKKAVLDWIVSLIALVVFAICCFFLKCSVDLWAVIIGAAVLIAGTVLVQIQNSKIKKAKE